jgi:hypothetical protein
MRSSIRVDAGTTNEVNAMCFNDLGVAATDLSAAATILGDLDHAVS